MPTYCCDACDNFETDIYTENSQLKSINPSSSTLPPTPSFISNELLPEDRIDTSILMAPNALFKPHEAVMIQVVETLSNGLKIKRMHRMREYYGMNREEKTLENFHHVKHHAGYKAHVDHPLLKMYVEEKEVEQTNDPWVPYKSEHEYMDPPTPQYPYKYYTRLIIDSYRKHDSLTDHWLVDGQTTYKLKAYDPENGILGESSALKYTAKDTAYEKEFNGKIPWGCGASDRYPELDKPECYVQVGIKYNLPHPGDNNFENHFEEDEIDPFWPESDEEEFGAHIPYLSEFDGKRSWMRYLKSKPSASIQYIQNNPDAATPIILTSYCYDSFSLGIKENMIKPKETRWWGWGSGPKTVRLSPNCGGNWNQIYMKMPTVWDYTHKNYYIYGLNYHANAQVNLLEDRALGTAPDYHELPLGALITNDSDLKAMFLTLPDNYLVSGHEAPPGINQLFWDLMISKRAEKRSSDEADPYWATSHNVWRTLRYPDLIKSYKTSIDNMVTEAEFIEFTPVDTEENVICPDTNEKYAIDQYQGPGETIFIRSGNCFDGLDNSYIKELPFNLYGPLHFCHLYDNLVKIFKEACYNSGPAGEEYSTIVSGVQTRYTHNSQMIMDAHFHHAYEKDIYIDQNISSATTANVNLTSRFFAFRIKVNNYIDPSINQHCKMAQVGRIQVSVMQAGGDWSFPGSYDNKMRIHIYTDHEDPPGSHSPGNLLHTSINYYAVGSFPILGSPLTLSFYFSPDTFLVEGKYWCIIELDAAMPANKYYQLMAWEREAITPDWHTIATSSNGTGWAHSADLYFSCNIAGSRYPYSRPCHPIYTKKIAGIHRIGFVCGTDIAPADLGLEMVTGKTKTNKWTDPAIAAISSASSSRTDKLDNYNSLCWFDAPRTGDGPQQQSFPFSDIHPFNPPNGAMVRPKNTGKNILYYNLEKSIPTSGIDPYGQDYNRYWTESKPIPPWYCPGLVPVDENENYIYIQPKSGSADTGLCETTGLDPKFLIIATAYDENDNGLFGGMYYRIPLYWNPEYVRYVPSHWGATQSWMEHLLPYPWELTLLCTGMAWVAGYEDQGGRVRIPKALSGWKRSQYGGGGLVELQPSDGVAYIKVQNLYDYLDCNNKKLARKITIADCCVRF
jgi:hypothetical protein